MDLQRANRAEKKGDFSEALRYYKRVTAKDPHTDSALEAARAGARVALLDLQDGRAAIEFYRLLIMYSPDQNERREAQVKIAQIYYENLNDYRAAIVEYNKLLQLIRDPNEEFRFRMPLAKSHYFLNQFVQARAELKTLLSKDISGNDKFDVTLLLANISLALKNHEEAAGLFRQLMKDHPDRSRKENVALNLVMALEEQKQFADAIEILQAARSSYPTPEFIDLRIKRLKERQSQLPGAKGLRK